MKRGLTAGLLSLALASLHAGTFHVSRTQGDDANDGSAEHPFRTIAKAVAAVDGVGGEIDLDPAGGPYREPMVFHKGGTPDQPVVVDGRGAVINLGLDVTAGPWTDTGNGFRLERPVAVQKRFWLATPAFVNGLPVFSDAPKNNHPQAAHGGSVRYDEQDRLILVFPRGLSPANAVVVLTGAGGPPGPDQFINCGVQLLNASHVKIRNLTSAFSANDGFNFHGTAGDVAVENTKSLFNGDQGYSSHELYEVDVRDSEVAFDGSGDAAVVDIQGTLTSYTNVRAHQNRGAAFSFRVQQKAARDGHHVLAKVVSFQNGTSNLPKVDPLTEVNDCQDLGQIGGDTQIPTVADPAARVDPAKPCDEADRLGRFLQMRPPDDQPLPAEPAKP